MPRFLVVEDGMFHVKRSKDFFSERWVMSLQVLMEIKQHKLVQCYVIGK